MISLIVCSRNAADLQAVSDSVASTIGVPYELIAIDNSRGEFGICAAYNRGASCARHDLLCFMHEDLRFHTPNWGQVVAETLADPTVGVLGVTGGMYQVAAPAAWWGCGPELCRQNVLEGYADGTQELVLHNPEGRDLADVAVVDGMWLCSRRDVWQQHPFDEHTLTDFHFYDVDYCTELFRHQLRICVTFRLLVEHRSRGSINNAWLRNALKYVQKRRGQLPFGPVTVEATRARALELKALQEFTGRLIRGGFPASLVMRHIMRCLTYDWRNRDTLWLLKALMQRPLLAGKQ